MGEEMHRDIIAHLPYLRAFAVTLSRDQTLANDLVQNAVLLSLSHADQFRAGTNFKAWISTILRNSFINEMRRRNRTSPVDVDSLYKTMTVSGGQEEHLQMRDLEKAFQTLPVAQREALMLMGANGLSQKEAAKMARCAIGTMKSRVSRARLQLRQILDDAVPDARNAARSVSCASGRVQSKRPQADDRNGMPLAHPG